MSKEENEAWQEDVSSFMDFMEEECPKCHRLNKDCECMFDEQHEKMIETELKIHNEEVEARRK